MKIQWFLPGLFSIFCVSCPAIAGELSSWQFDQSQNVLEFTTDDDVQPRAQLVPDPTRLVIDLPGTTPGDVERSQAVGGIIRQVRIGQFDANTTRIVVELAPGYMLDPQQVRFRGLSPTQWTVQLPEPQYVGLSSSPLTGASPSPSPSPSPAMPAAAISAPQAPPVPNPALAARPAPAVSPAPAISPAPLPSHTPTSSTAAAPPTDSSLTQITGLRITDDGLFVRTQGETPEIRTSRSRDRRSFTITVDHAVLSPQFTERELAVEQYDIEEMAFKQTDDDPPQVEITLKVDRDSPNWQTSVSGLGGIVLLPPSSSSATAQRPSRSDSRSDSRRARNSRSEERSNDRNPEPDQTPISATPTSNPTAPIASAESNNARTTATIEGIELDSSGTQLLIRSDRPVSHSGRWQSGMYVITLETARLAEQVTGPELDTDSPLLRVRLRQEEDETVVITIQPASGVRFGTLNAVTPQLLALEMERSRPTAVTSPATPVSSPAPSPAAPSPALAAPNLSIPQIPSGRVVVVIDPGHGGADVGAVGINDLYEADVVLAISQQVGALLQQQGVYVLMTRNSDLEIDLEPRVQMAEQANATLFVSIHANSMGMDRPDVNGTETYYYSSGAGLAEAIQNSIVSSIDVNDRGVRQARFYVLRHTSMPAVLVETGYVTGSEDGPRLADANFQSQMARAIAQGILQYVQRMAAGQF
ncbi:MAG: hypothetical protein Kow00121_24190 [Elainellaceae cyanobacterium]